jgi:hypothetical protein
MLENCSYRADTDWGEGGTGREGVARLRTAGDEGMAGGGVTALLPGLEAAAWPCAKTGSFPCCSTCVAVALMILHFSRTWRFLLFFAENFSLQNGQAVAGYADLQAASCRFLSSRGVFASSSRPFQVTVPCRNGGLLYGIWLSSLTTGTWGGSTRGAPSSASMAIDSDIVLKYSASSVWYDP